MESRLAHLGLLESWHGPKRTQSYTRISLVCGCTTKHWLEERMDWPHPTAHYPVSLKCSKSDLHPPNQKCSLHQTWGEILYWKGHYPSQAAVNARKGKDTQGIPVTQNSLQQREIPATARAHHIGSCYKAIVRNLLVVPSWVFKGEAQGGTYERGRDWRWKGGPRGGG
jgi:hypothetical protein